MATTQELTYAEVSEHNTKKDLLVVIHDKVYDVSDFVDEHPFPEPSLEKMKALDVTADSFIPYFPPCTGLNLVWGLIKLISKSYTNTSGGDEVLLDVGGLDATEAFEDVGHSDEARQILAGFLVAKLKRKPGDPIPKVAPPAGSTTTSPDTTGLGVGLYALVLLGGLLAFFGYRYMQASSKAEAL